MDSALKTEQHIFWRLIDIKINCLGIFLFPCAKIFLGKISKPLTNKDLASMTVPFSEFMIDHRSYAHNLSCCERDSNSWPLWYRFSALPTELSSQLGAGHIVSSYFVFRVSHLACSTCCCEKWREGLLWTTNFNFAARSSNSQLVNIFSDKWRICVSRLVKQSQGLPHEAFHVATKPI